MAKYLIKIILTKNHKNKYKIIILIKQLSTIQDKKTKNKQTRGSKQQ